MNHVVLFLLFLLIAVGCGEETAQVKEDKCDGIVCSENASCSEGVCSCKETFHKEGKACLLNMKMVSCISENIPKNGSATVTDVAVNWNKDEETWSEASACKVKCDDEYHFEEALCVSNTKMVPCVDQAPEDATSIDDDVAIIWWRDFSLWSSPDLCKWRCDETFHQEGNRCYSNTKMVPCIDTAPKNSTVSDADVEVIWGNNQWSDASCSWRCNDGYGEATGGKTCGVIPEISSITVISNNQINIVFNLALNDLFAIDIENYAIEGVTITEAVVSTTEPYTVSMIIKEDIVPHQEYLLAITNLESASGVIKPAESGTFMRRYLTSCDEILKEGLSVGDGIYTVDFDGAESNYDLMDVYCDMTTAGGGWMMVLRLNSNDNTTRQWSDIGFWESETEVGDIEPTALCENGILSDDGEACCPEACGQCGGADCDLATGGAAACCATNILSAMPIEYCDQYDAPCAINVDSDKIKRDYLSPAYAAYSAWDEILVDYRYTPDQKKRMAAVFANAENSGSLKSNSTMTPNNMNPSWYRTQVFNEGDSVDAAAWYGTELKFQITGHPYPVNGVPKDDNFRIWYGKVESSTCNLSGGIGGQGDGGNWWHELSFPISEVDICQENEYRGTIGSNGGGTLMEETLLEPQDAYNDGMMYVFVRKAPEVTDGVLSVISTDPDPDETNVNLNSDVVLVFNLSIPADADKSQIKILDSEGETPNGIVVITNRIFKFTPVAYKADETYTVTVETGFGSGGMTTDSDYVFTFKTGTTKK